VPRALQHRLDRLAQAHARQELRLVVLEVDADRHGDAALVDRMFAEAGVELRPADLVVKVLRFGPPSGSPPRRVARVDQPGNTVGGSR
jgi:hypothetical protein